MTYLDFVKSNLSDFENTGRRAKLIDKYLKTKPSMLNYFTALVSRGVKRDHAMIAMLGAAESGLLQECHAAGCMTLEYWDDYYAFPVWALCGISAEDLK